MDDRLDPLALDRDLRRTAERWRRWRRALVRGEGFDSDPFALTREAIGQTTFQRIADEIGDGDPLAAPLRRWVYRLAEQRINSELIVHIERLRRVEQHPLDEPVEGEFSLATMLLRILSEPDRREPWLAQLIERVEPVTRSVAHLWERRREVATRLGVTDPDSIESPSPAIDDAARAWLTRTRDVARDLGGKSFEQTLDLAMASTASRGWPARPTLRHFAEWLNEARLLESLPLDVGDLPDALGGASFLRALARLGAGFVDATAPARQPFVVAHDPYGLRRRRMGALFARLLLAPDFVRKRLELDRSQIQPHRRAIAGSLLVESRTAAARVLLRRAALDSASLSDRYQELTGELFGRPLPARAAGAIVRIPDDAGSRFAGLLLSALDTETLTHEHDEDWYRNPRAAEQLRSETELSPPITTSSEELASGAERLAQELFDALD